MNKLTLSSQSILMIACSIACVTIVALLVQRVVIRSQGIELTRNTMRALVVEGESVRESVSELSRSGAFDFPHLLEELRSHEDYRDSKIYRTIPVVAAWDAISQASRSEGYQFRVVRENPRNPKNAPNERELSILRALEGSGADDYFEVDHETELMTYARPILLSKDCLSCHGDPADSFSGDGKDILGFDMEGWEEGEMRGAFILDGDLGKVDQVVAASFGQTLLWLLPCAGLVILVSGFILRKGVVRPLLASIAAIGEASRQTDSAASSISQASQELAGGACRSASGIQETNGALETVLTETRIAANLAKDAAALSSETSHMAREGGSQMESLLASMNDIRKSSDAVSKIISTIDEIAFQTNILALNAAVEAARAGASGAGFSVVAEEVRSLSQRTARAASETTQLIDEAVASSRRGESITIEVRKRLEQIIANSSHLDAAVSKVDSACRKQEQSVGRIRESVAELDSITQANAAGAEETASASEELNAQATVLEDMIRLMSSMLERSSVEAKPLARVEKPSSSFRADRDATSVARWN